MRAVAAGGVRVRTIDAECRAIGPLAWSAVRERQCVEAVLEPAHANLLEASVLPTVHVLTNHRVEIGVGLPEQEHIPLIARGGAQGVGVIATGRRVVLIRLEVPNNHVGVAAAKGSAVRLPPVAMLASGAESKSTNRPSAVMAKLPAARKANDDRMGGSKNRGRCESGGREGDLQSPRCQSR